MKKAVIRTLAGVAGLGSLAWLGASAVLAVNQRKYIFNPLKEPEAENPKSAGHHTRTITLTSTDGTRLSGWLLTPETAGPHPAVLYFGGRSEEVSWAVRDAARLFPGMLALVVNYRGYGNSGGEPGEPQMVDDAEMLWHWLTQRPNVDPDRIAVVGRSLGSGIAVKVAVTHPVAALVLVTPYDSLVAIAKRRFRAMPIGFTMKHRFESIRVANRISAPVYVLRSESDDVVPHAHTDQLVARLRTLVADETVPNSDHHNIPYLEDAQLRIGQFLSTHLKVKPHA